MQELRRFFSGRRAVIVLFTLYFFVGIFIYKDYGISWDEAVERRSSLANYVYAFEKLMGLSSSQAVQDMAKDTPELATWSDRFYGTFLQCITVLVEHLHNFEMTSQEIFYMRHLFNFINYFLAGIFFYLILLRRFKSGIIPLLGVLFYILYPRFFGESFYNNKDILFYAWCIIASYFVLRWLEDNNGKIFTLPAAAAIAIATNTRILGIAILLLACGLAFVRTVWHKENVRNIGKKTAILFLLTYVCYVVITPFTWENPIKNTMDTFFHFMRFQPWNGTHFYMGEMIRREVPWHYLPVWMGITIPILYFVLFILGIATVFIGMYKYLLKMKRGKNEGLQEPCVTSPHLYDVFFALFFVCTLLGYILLKISMYEGWRHGYILYFPFLYITVYGLERFFTFAQPNQKLRRLKAGIVALCLGYLLVWNVINHPYQYVFFNVIGKQFAEKNFALDYWGVSQADLVRYVLANDDRPIISFSGFGGRAVRILTEQERQRVVEMTPADYHVQHTRARYSNRIRRDNYEEINAIIVDGMKISILFKRIEPDFDSGAWNKIIQVESNANDNFDAMHDGKYNTRWSTRKKQEPGVYIMFEFAEQVDYTDILLHPGRWPDDYPRDLSIYTSNDGSEWKIADVTVADNCYFSFSSEPYRFLKLEINGSTDSNWWSIYDLRFGYAR